MSFYDGLKYREWERAGLNWHCASHEMLARALIPRCFEGADPIQPSPIQDDPLANAICAQAGCSAISLNNLGFRLHLHMKDYPAADKRKVSFSSQLTETMTADLLADASVTAAMDLVQKTPHRRPSEKLSDALDALVSTGRKKIYPHWRAAFLEQTFKKTTFVHWIPGTPGSGEQRIDINDMTRRDVFFAADQWIEIARRPNVTIGRSIFAIEAEPMNSDVGSSSLQAYFFAPFKDGIGGNKRRKPVPRRETAKVWGWLPAIGGARLA